MQFNTFFQVFVAILFYAQNFLHLHTPLKSLPFRYKSDCARQNFNLFTKLILCSLVMKFVLITLFLVIFNGIKSHAWRTQSHIGNNNAFQSGMSRFNSANQQSDLLSENSGYTMVINLPTLLKALKKSSLQHNQLQQRPGKQQLLTQQQNSYPVHPSLQQQPAQQFSQHQPQNPQSHSQFLPSQPIMTMRYPADTQPMPSQYSQPIPSISLLSQQNENTTAEATDENKGSNIETRLKVCKKHLNNPSVNVA